VNAECTLQGQYVRLSDVLVSPPQREPFLVDLGSYIPNSGVESVSMTLPDRFGGFATLQVTAAIAFRGQRQDPVLAVRSGITANEGMVLLWPGALLTQARSQGAIVLGTVPFAFALEDEPWNRVTLVESVASVRVPCDALTFGATQFPAGNGFDDESAGEPSWWQLRRESSQLVLRRQPNWNAPRIVLVRGPQQRESAFSVRFLSERAGWLNVAHAGQDAWGSSAEVRGWIPKADLIPASTYSVDDGVRDYDERGGCGFRHSKTPPPVPAYEGYAQIAIGTKIYAEPNHSPWATVRTDAQFFVKYFPGDTWAWVKWIPEIRMSDCSQPLPAYVPLTALTITPSPTH